MSGSDGAPAGRNPLTQIQASAHALARDVGNAWHQTAQRVQHGADNIGRTLSHAVQVPGQALIRHAQGMHVQPLLPGCAVRPSMICRLDTWK